MNYLKYKKSFVINTKQKSKKTFLPYALESKDIIGSIQTGSGKAFAYGILIIQKSLILFFVYMHISTDSKIMSLNK